MAKAKSPLFSMKASGKVADTLVCAPWKGKSGARKYVVPANTITPARNVVRGHFADAVAEWYAAMYNTLDREAWARLARMSNESMSGYNHMLREYLQVVTVAGLLWQRLSNVIISDIGASSFRVNVRTFPEVGPILYSLSFDGVDDFVSVPHSASLNITAAITMEVWVRQNVRSVFPAIINKYDGTVNTGYILSLGFSAGSIGVYIRPGLAAFFETTDIVPLGVWRHIVVTWSDGDRIRVFVDGAFAAESGIVTGLGTNTRPFRISGIEGGFTFFNGLINEARIYNRALSAAEVAEHHAGIYRDNTGLVGLWHFNEGSGAVAYDSSWLANHGSIIGASWSTDHPPIPVRIEAPVLRWGRGWCSLANPVVMSGVGFSPFREFTAVVSGLEPKTRYYFAIDAKSPTRSGITGIYEVLTKSV